MAITKGSDLPDVFEARQKRLFEEEMKGLPDLIPPLFGGEYTPPTRRERLGWLARDARRRLGMRVGRWIAGVRRADVGVGEDFVAVDP